MNIHSSLLIYTLIVLHCFSFLRGNNCFYLTDLINGHRVRCSRKDNEIVNYVTMKN